MKIRKSTMIGIAAIVCALNTAHAATPILWDINDGDTVLNAVVADFNAGGVTEDITGATVSHVLGTTGGTMTDANGVSLTYVSGGGRGPYSNPNSSDPIIHEYLAIKDTTCEMQISGLSSHLDASSDYALYLWGVGDNTAQSSSFTVNGQTINIDNSIDPDGASASSFVAKFPFSTDAVVSDTLDFTWAEQAQYGGLNGFAIVDYDGVVVELPPAAPSGVYTVISNMAVQVKWNASSGSDIGYNVKRALVGETSYVTLGSTIDTVYLDTTVETNETYDYVVSATNLVGEGSNSGPVTGVGLQYDIIGGPSSYSEDLDVDNLFDNDFDTKFDTQGDEYAGLDYGTAKQIVHIEYVIRSDWGSALARSHGATFEGADNPEFTDAVVLHTVPDTVEKNPVVNSFAITDTGSYRYVRLNRSAAYPLYSFTELDVITTDDVTVNGTPNDWLDAYYEIPGSNFADYAEADVSDTDNDGLLAWQEFKMNGDPTDANSPVGVNNLYAWPESPLENVVRWDSTDLADVANGGGYIVYRSLVDSNYTAIATVTTNVYTDTGLTAGVSYYYKATVTNATYEHETALSDGDFAVANEYQIIGLQLSEGSNKSLWFYKLFDATQDTFLDDNANGGYAGLDYGVANGQQIQEVAFRLRNDGWANYGGTLIIDGVTNSVTRAQERIYGNTFEGSNDTNGSWTVIATIDNIADMDQWNLLPVTDVTAYRYVRFNNASTWNNYAMADVEFLSASDYTAQGTPIFWLEEYGLTDGDDTVDVDSDGHESWQEFQAYTDPTDSNSVLKISSYSDTNGLSITWQSVAGVSYSVITTDGLVYGTPEAIETGIIGSGGETTYTTNGVAFDKDAEFFYIGVE